MSCYKLNQDEIHSVQSRLLEIMVDIDRIAREHGIQYILFGGSLLGCVRHKGFIPWDDDLDIALTRNEYEKLRKACLEELKPEFFWQDKYTDKNYPLDFAKIRYNDTLFIEDRLSHLDIHHGLFLDIFPLDNVFKLFKKPHAKIIWHLQCIKKNRVGLRYNTIFEKFINIKLISKLLQLIPINVIDSLINYFITCLNPLNTGYVNQLCHFGSNKPLIDKNLLLNLTEKEFEGHKFLVPKDYHLYLRDKYGDYLLLPSKDKRKPTHKIVDFQLSDHMP
jgi:lipopolysaccharide cholinephosphotransferase